MREPETPEENAIQHLTEEWARRAGKVFRPSESYFIHIPKDEYFFVSLERLIPVIESLEYLPILNVYRLSTKDLKKLRSKQAWRNTSIMYIQFGEVRIEGFPHWEPIVASFDLVPAVVQEAKNEWDRCQFIREEISKNPDSDRSKRNVRNIDQESSHANAALAASNEMPGFLTFKESGLLLSKLPLLERLF